MINKINIKKMFKYFNIFILSFVLICSTQITRAESTPPAPDDGPSPCQSDGTIINLLATLLAPLNTGVEGPTAPVDGCSGLA